MDNVSLVKLLELHDLLNNKGGKVVEDFGEISFSFSASGDRLEFENLCVSLGFKPDNISPVSFSIPNSIGNTILFETIDGLLDKINLNPQLTDQHNFFVFNYEDRYLYFEFETKNTTTGLESNTSVNIIRHYIQYNELLSIYKNAKGRLFEIEKSLAGSNELVIVSKGEEKFIIGVSYKRIDKAILKEEYFELPIEIFKTKIISDEWLACYNNTLCQYMEMQSHSRKTFANLYNNFIFVLNQTEKNFQLYISRFSFEKIKNQFKAEKNSYFESLNNAQEKISGQIIAVPISLGAAILSFYQFTANLSTLVIIYISIVLYVIFIAYAVVMNLFDVEKVASDVNEEKDKLFRHYQDHYQDFKKDFDFLKNKRVRLRILAYSLITALILTVILITIFIIAHEAQEKPPFHLLKEHST